MSRKLKLDTEREILEQNDGNSKTRSYQDRMIGQRACMNRKKEDDKYFIWHLQSMWNWLSNV